jgi:ribose-phosphate pyrophosphokinase
MDIDHISEDDEHVFISRANAKRLIREAVDGSLLRLTRAPLPFKLFGLGGSQDYAQKVATHLGKKLTPHVEKSFEDGEIYVKPVSDRVGSVRGHNVFVIQSLYSDDMVVFAPRLMQLLFDFVAQNPALDSHEALKQFASYIVNHSGETVCDKFLKLCMFCGALRDASANEVTVVIPHLAWARQDRKTESRAPISTKYIAQMLEAVGVKRCLFIDVHNLAAEQNAFRIPIDNLETRNLHAHWCASTLKERQAKKIRVLTPDSGGLPRCTRFRNALATILGEDHEDNIEICIFDKVREKGIVRGGRIIGDVEDAEVIAYDDMISTGGTMGKACQAVLAANGRLLAICAAHGLFCGKANSIFENMDTTLLVADTVSPFRLSEHNQQKVQQIDTTGMVAEAILRIHSGTGSISELLELG